MVTRKIEIESLNEMRLAIAKLADDLVDYLNDRGAWDVGSGGTETVTDIAEFLANSPPIQRLELLLRERLEKLETMEAFT